MTTIRIGTCSWADEALSKYFYPPGTPSGERLPYYAQHFDTVEVDSTYYRLPVPEMVERWAERTPEDFVLHVKAFGAMTRHPVKLEALPTDLRDEAPVDDKGRLERPSREFRAELFRRFLQELAGQAEQAFVLFNNNNRSPSGDGGFVAQAATNAFQLRKLLAEAEVPVS